ncbi:MAG: hypothetical protein KDA24_21245 [Deltaproteobacteria bacterium]|nr:hypothetical protein [Deltaproteobacteria bacterium]
MQARVRFVLPDGSMVALGPGDLIGRTAAAALQLDDGRISEAHALVSLRGGTLRLLALRGLFAVEGHLVSAVTLSEGLAIELAPGLRLTTRDVTLPPRVLALGGDGLHPQVLGSISSLMVDPEPRLSTRYEPDADALLWNRGESWLLQRRGHEPRPVQEGDSFELAGRSFCLTSVPLGHMDRRATAAANRPPITVEHGGRRVDLYRGSEHLTTVRGNGAAIVEELVEFAGPVDWYTLARQIWTEEGSDRKKLRGRLDTTLKRLRERFREVGIAATLVASTQSGQLELLTSPADLLVERS